MSPTCFVIGCISLLRAFHLIKNFQPSTSVGCTSLFKMLPTLRTLGTTVAVVGCTSLFKMLSTPICYNYLLYNNLRYLPSGISPQHKGFQQPHLNIFIQLFSFISKLLFTNVYHECGANIRKINKNKASVN